MYYLPLIEISYCKKILPTPLIFPLLLLPPPLLMMMMIHFIHYLVVELPKVLVFEQLAWMV
jgi:hypothetical protein